jgi:hypothetical protein
MEFRVFKDREYSDIPQGYSEIPGMMIFNEPLTKVEWSEFLSNMYYQGYRSCSDVYYIKPGSLPPQELVLLTCQEDLDQVMRAHQGTKKCDVYIVTNCPFVSDNEYEMSEEVFILPSFNKLYQIFAYIIFMIALTNTFLCFWPGAV